MEPPWSPPIPTSTSPAATAAATPLEDPPEVYSSSWGLITGPDRENSPLPANERLSMFSFAVIVAPASRRRSTTVASWSGT